MNGGTCFKIPSVSTPTCVCSANYEGSRCEQFQLFSFSHDSQEKGMIAAVIIIALLILRNGQSQPKPEEYLRVKSSSQPWPAEGSRGVLTVIK
ncbi:Pro-neuregulin-4, membrane-bound isoform [Labeo rohita]|uniref:Pro-neuregulin-4, membrane-bound isoform n=1 Tax=Labeo rohita TaxID=84645 RepID=A0ABQ8LBY6_LABRO|nr:Pro-neuregulin-4, membrane-bound isoform [Labeo rohita]